MFRRVNSLPFSRRWVLVKLKECEFFAVKVDSWFAYKGHIHKIRKKTHKVSSCK